MAVSDFPTKGDDMAVSLRNSGFDRFDRDYAEKLKSDYPDIWAAGGNIRGNDAFKFCLLYTSPSPRDSDSSRMPSSA